MDPGLYRHVIWDWNGTLLDDAWLCRAAINDLLVRRGRPPLSSRRYQAIFDFPVRDYYRRAGFDLDREPFEQLGDEFITIYERRRAECRLQPHARRVLRHIQARGLTQSVLSAYRHERLVGALAKYKLSSFFTRVQGEGDDYARGKLEAGRRGLPALGVPPERIVLIGDTTHDFAVARSLGVGCWLVPSGNHTRDKLAGCGVPVLDSLRDLLTW